MQAGSMQGIGRPGVKRHTCMAMSRVLSAMQSGGRSTLNHGCSCTCRHADPTLWRCSACTTCKQAVGSDQSKLMCNSGTRPERHLTIPAVTGSPPPLWHARQDRGTTSVQAATRRLQISRLLAGTPPAGSTTPLRMLLWKPQPYTKEQLCITSANGGVLRPRAALVRLQLPSTAYLHDAQRHAAQPRRWVLWGSVVLVPPKRK